METSAKTASNVNGARERTAPRSSGHCTLRRDASRTVHSCRRSGGRPRPLLGWAPRLSVARRPRPPAAEMFYEIARKLPKSSPVTAPAAGIVLSDRVRARRWLRATAPSTRSATSPQRPRARAAAAGTGEEEERLLLG